MAGGGRRRRRGLGRGLAVAAVSGLALLALTFFTWYGSEVSGQAGAIEFAGAGAGGSAWQTLAPLAVLLALTGLAALALAALRLAGSGWRPALAPEAALAVLGGLSTLLVAIRIVFPPDLGELGGIAVEATLTLAPFLALAAAAGVAYGGYRAMGEAGSSFASVAEALGPRPG